jgi:hypothetical protein
MDNIKNEINNKKERKRKPALQIIGFLGIGILLAANLFFMHNNGSVSKAQEDFPQRYQIISPEIPENLDFCGEKVPIDNFYVKERVDGAYC